MKKLFFLLAFTGVVGAASATSFASITHSSVITITKGDDKDKDKKKKCDKDHACCKSKSGEASTKSCSGEKTSGKSCCKSKTASTTTENKTTTDTKSTTPNNK